MAALTDEELQQQIEIERAAAGRGKAPAQIDSDGNAIATGKPPVTAMQIHEAGRELTAKQRKDPDWGWNPQPADVSNVVIPPPATQAKPAGLYPEPNWNYNPQDDFVPSGNPPTRAQIAASTPGINTNKATHLPFYPEDVPQDGYQPEYGWNPQVGFEKVNPVGLLPTGTITPWANGAQTLTMAVGDVLDVTVNRFNKHALTPAGGGLNSTMDGTADDVAIASMPAVKGNKFTITAHKAGIAYYRLTSGAGDAQSCIIIVVKEPFKGTGIPVDDVAANMASIWTPDPVYFTAKGGR